VHTNGQWCGGYPYNIIVVVFFMIVIAVSGYFVYEDMAAPGPTPSPTVFSVSHSPTNSDHDKTRAPTAEPTSVVDQAARGGVNPPTPWSVGDSSPSDDVAVETTPSGPVNSPATSPAVGSKQRLRR